MEPIKIPKKVNRHVIKAIDFLQTSRKNFVHIGAITDQVRRSLRDSKPVSNLDAVINESLRRQTELGIVSRSGSSMFAMTLAFQGLRSDRNVHKIKKHEAHKQSIDSLTVDEIASVRKILRGVQKPLLKTRSRVLSRALFKRKSSRNVLIRPRKPSKIVNPIIYDKFGMNIENLSIPKQVNRHVFKAVRYFNNNENCEFVPLDKIKMEVKWSMKNLNPLRDLETVIERSLTNLSNMGVLSELRGTYRLNPVQSLPADSSFGIFGKVSKYFFHEAPIDEPLLTDLHSSKDSLASCTNLDRQFSPLTSAPSVGNSLSIVPSDGHFKVPMVIPESLSHEIQGADKLPNISFMEKPEMRLDEGMSDDSNFFVSQGTMQSSIQAEKTSPLCPKFENVRASEGVIGEEPMENGFSIELRTSEPSQAPLVTLESPSQEIQGTDESKDISFVKPSKLPLDEPVSDHSSSVVPLILNFRASEGVFGVQSENASSVPFCVQLPVMAAENISQEEHNDNAHNEMGFYESWLQSTSNESETLFPRAANIECEESSSAETSEHRGESDEQ